MAQRRRAAQNSPRAKQGQPSPVQAAREREAVCRDVEAWIASVLPALRLSHWGVHLEREPCPSDRHAEVTMIYGSRAYIRIEAGWGALSAEDRRQYLTHELCHLYLDRTCELLEGLEDALGPATWAALNPAITATVENAVDSIAKVLAPLLPPLPA